MISATELLVVLLAGVSVVTLLYWFRRFRSSNSTPIVQTETCRIEAATPAAPMGDAATATNEETAEEEVHEPNSTHQGDRDLESRAESAGDQRQTLGESANEKAAEEEHHSSHAGTLTNAGEHLERASRPLVSGPNTVSDRDASEPADSLRDGTVTERCQRPTVSEENAPAPDSANVRVEQPPLASAGSPALESHHETPADEEAEEEALPAAPEGEVTDSARATTLPATRQQPQNESGREPRRYGGLTRRPPRPRNNNRNKSAAATADTTEREQSLPIEVRLRFDRGGACTSSLIASRLPSAPESATVSAASGPLDLLVMQDEWYQDVIPEDIGRILSEGAMWSQVGGTGRWSLSGRELYVLGEHSELSGWVSQPCLKLGRKHVILCTEALRPAAEQALREAGVDHLVALDVSFGSPAGWVVIRDVFPVHSVSPSRRADILNALRPLPEVEIRLEGGIRLEKAMWLEGYAPLIRVYGDPARTPEVRIDDCTASCGDDGAYRVPGCDATGTHTVWYAGISKSYSVVPFEASWGWWDAYAFPATRGSDRRVAICGPAVSDAFDSQHDWTTTIQVPETNTVILGAAPGEHALAIRTSRIRGMPCFASPSFRPVWALPPDPLLCSKQATRVLFLGEFIEPIPRLVGNAAGRCHPSVDTWAKLVLDASRKGLAIKPDTEQARALWRRYKRAARDIWRLRK